MPKKASKKSGTGSNRRSFAPAGFFTAPDGKHYPLNGRDRTSALYQWKRERRDGGRAAEDFGIGGEVIASAGDGGLSDDDGNIGGTVGDDATGRTDSGGGNDGRPRIVRRRAGSNGRSKTGAKQKAVVGTLDLDEDTIRLNRLVVGFFGFAQVVRQCPVWAISEQDALIISEPLSECLKKYPKVAAQLLEVAPPMALAIGIASTVGPRVMADKMWHDMQKAQQAAQTPVGSNPPPEAQPSQVYQTVPPPNERKGTDTGFPKDLGAIAEAWNMQHAEPVP